jgi:hypothetical protein
MKPKELIVNEGSIRQTIRRQARSLIITSSVIVALCLAILAFNWKYVFNWVAGPVPFTAALAANPGAREFVSAKGELKPTGFAQESVIKLKGKIELPKNVTAEYMTIQVEGKMLLVKAPPNFTGTTVEGRLVPIPAELSRGLPVDSSYFPWMVAAQTAYRWDFNLLVLGAVLVLPLSVFFLAVFLWRGADPARNPAIRDLKRFGSPLQVVDKIEAEIVRTGEAGEVGPLFFTPSWLVAFEPLLKIFAISELAGIGKIVKFKKAGAEAVHFLVLWTRGKPLSEELQVGEAVAAAAMQKVTITYPWLAIDKPKEFAVKWTSDRAGCEREQEQRKKVCAGQ